MVIEYSPPYAEGEKSVTQLCALQSCLQSVDFDMYLIFADPYSTHCSVFIQDPKMKRFHVFVISIRENAF